MRKLLIILVTLCSLLPLIGCSQSDPSPSNKADPDSSLNLPSTASRNSYSLATSSTKLADGIYYDVTDPGQNHLAIVDGKWRVVFEHVYEWAECDVSELPNGGFQVSVRDFKGDDGESPYNLEFIPQSEENQFDVLEDGKPFQGFEGGFVKEVDIPELKRYYREVYED